MITVRLIIIFGVSIDYDPALYKAINRRGDDVCTVKQKRFYDTETNSAAFCAMH